MSRACFVDLGCFAMALRALPTRRVSLQSDRRKFSPYGLQGGSDGQPGRNFTVGRDGVEKSYPGKATLTLESGEVGVVETPGGGGWGPPEDK